MNNKEKIEKQTGKPFGNNDLRIRGLDDLAVTDSRVPQKLKEEHYAQRFDSFPSSNLDERGLRNVNEMLKKKEQNGGVVYGFHGTSKSRATQIIDNGFENRRAVDGQFGVFIWDEEYRNNAVSPAEQKAKEDGDTEYAIIKVKMKNASADWLQGRPQWLGLAQDVEILDVEYYPFEG